MDCVNYLFLIGRAALEELVHQFRGCICFSGCDMFPRITCILWDLKHLLMKERESRDTIQQDKIMLLVESFVVLVSGRKKKMWCPWLVRA